MAQARALGTASVLSGGKMFVAGGGDSFGALSPAESYDPVAETGRRARKETERGTAIARFPFVFNLLVLRGAGDRPDRDRKDLADPDDYRQQQ